MIKSLKKLIEALREELKHYGEMLVLLDRQQEFLITRAADEVSDSIGLVQNQSVAIQQARQRREECFCAVAESAGRKQTSTFAELIPVLPADYQPLLKALVDENNELLARVCRRAGQNHLILKRSVELMQQVMTSLRPVDSIPPGAGRGRGKLRSGSRATRRLHTELN